MITQDTILNAVIGHPLEHTQSPRLHSQAYQDAGLNAVMLAFAHKDVAALVNSMRTLGIELTAVTMPHKESILEHLDEIDEDARAIGAVNTVIQREGKLHGYNTDLIGIARSLQKLDLKGKKVMLLGAGGAARPLAHHVTQAGAELLIWNRTPERAQELAEAYGAQAVTEPEPADLLVNATPLGMAPHEHELPIRPELIEWYSHVFDLIYSPFETALLKEAKSRDKFIIQGLHMFVAQALEQIRLWSGKELDPKIYFQMLAKEL